MPRAAKPNLPIVSVLVPTAPVRLKGGVALGHVYDYLVPPELSLAPGDYVEVNFARQPLVGVVWDTPPDPDVPVKKLKPVSGKMDIPPLPEVARKFTDWLSGYTLSPPGSVLRMTLAGTGGLQRPLKSASRAKLPATVKDAVVPQLSSAQAEAAIQLRQYVKDNKFSVTLLDGVTGAGKTEVYAEAVAEVLRSGKQALVMLPEIALTGQLLARLAARFGFAPIEWHSGLTPAQRRRNWHAIATGDAKLILGARSSLLLPYLQLGLIVVDEEHEAVYKQEEGVIYQARDMAVVRANLGSFPVILSTATPALETWANVNAHKYNRVALPGRYAEAALPGIELVDLRIEQPQKIGKIQTWLSPPLVAALNEQLARGEQSLLYLNRRGYAPLTLCRHCGYRFQCPQCTAWMVSHGGRNQDVGTRLQCHHCGYGMQTPQACPECHAPDQLAACGPGVERLAEEVALRFPQARVEQLTSDHPETPAETRALIERMVAGEIDILIGTQMVTKGHHFPHLTLVGVVDADLGLAGGDLRAAERTYQLLTQVAGRAGRSVRSDAKQSRVLIQTVDPAQPLMQALKHGTTLAARDVFLAAQLRERQMFKMPPAGRLAALILAGVERDAVERAARELGKTAPRGETGIHVLGPAPAPLSMLRGRHRIRFLVKAPKDARLQGLMADWLKRTDLPPGVQVTVDIDPYSFL